MLGVYVKCVHKVWGGWVGGKIKLFMKMHIDSFQDHLNYL